MVWYGVCALVDSYVRYEQYAYAQRRGLSRGIFGIVHGEVAGTSVPHSRVPGLYLTQQLTTQGCWGVMFSHLDRVGVATGTMNPEAVATDAKATAQEVLMVL